MSVLGIIGELLITVGVIAFLYVGWQLWLGDVIQAAQKDAAGSELSEQWADAFETAPPAPETSESPDPTASADAAAAVPVLAQPGDAEEFAVLRVPRWGADYSKPIAGGVSRSRTLDPIGVGHYPNTQMPGEIGNFAVAGHRTTYGKPFADIETLRIGDAIVVETPGGWYTYRFRTLEYVRPTETTVLAPVPQLDVAAGDAYITMTSCSPRWSMAERIVAYGVFESFTPRTDGPPASLTEGTTA
ncbi:class E sortase [Microbacterium sp. bgisy207]|uniref:class E sortase n=1 Tax=Microbacterium sp. bgisy207 TaxID=3413800 RepID=UPI003EB82989